MARATLVTAVLACAVTVALAQQRDGAADSSAVAAPWTPCSQLQARCDGSPVRCSVTAPLGEADTRETLRDALAARARHEIVDGCGSYVSSTARVERGQLRSYSVLDITSGIVTDFRYEPIWQSPRGSSDPFLTLNIEARAKAMPGDPDDSFKVTAALDKKSYNHGDAGRLEIELSQSAYLYIFGIGSDGAIGLLFPTRIASQNKIVAGTFTFPPDERYNLRFAAAATQASEHATEHIVVLASKKPLDFASIGVREAIGKPVTFHDSASRQRLGEYLVSRPRSEIAEATIKYEIYRPR